MKPFIVVEGYNTSRIAPHLVGESNKNNTVELFLESIFVRFGNNTFFDDALEQAGYDLIYIDFNEGTDYIQRNAALFEEVLRWVNNQKQQAGSVELNVVMGESMGGLVARYGLARLVRNGYDPQTRKLILHDSPQRAAYNPMGVQALTLQTDFPILPNIRTRDLSDKLNEGLNVLNAPATKQLSLKIVTGIDNEYEDNSFIDGPYKAMVDFAPSGGPPSTFPTIVATSDGSQCGRLQPTPPHQALALNMGAYLLNPFIATIGFKSDAIINALPAYGQQDRLAHLRVYFTIAVLWMNLDITVLNRNYESPANTLPYEILPGGYTNLADQQGLAGGFLFPNYWNFTVLYNGPICFVPSYSALDVGTITPATAAVSYLYGAPPQTSAVPQVAKFIAMEQSGGAYNQAHLRFTARNSQWIFNEMQGLPTAPLNCMAECSPYPPVPIAGLDIVCSTGSTTFSVTPPFGSVTDWTVSPGGLVRFATPTAGATSVTMEPVSVTSVGLITLTANLSNGCFSTTTSRKVAVGQGFLVVNDGRNTPTCATPSVEYRISEGYGAQGPYTWQVSAGFIESGQGTDRIIVQGLPYQDYRFVATVSSPATCPGAPALQAIYRQDYYTQEPGEAFPCPRFRPAPSPTVAPTATLYPNPARETVDVHLEQADASAAAPVTVRLFDGYGRARAERTSHGETTVRLPTEALPAGLYFVHILRGRQVLSRQQLRIEK